MGRRKIISSLDIGTSVIRAVIAELNSYGALSIIGLGQAKSRGMRKGVVVDIDAVAESIIEAREQAQRMAGVSVTDFYVGLPTSYINIISNKGVVAVSGEDKEISIEDVDRVLQASRVVAVPMNKEIVDVIPKQFILDGHEGIREPVGMVGVRLEAETMLIAATATSLQNIMRCIEKAECNVIDFVINPLAISEVCLSEDAKRLGVVLIDVGGGTIEVSAFRDNELRGVASIALGGDHITNDIAVGLKTSFTTAEAIKMEYGLSLDEDTAESPIIEIASVGDNRPRKIDHALLSGIIQARVEEMFCYIADELTKFGFSELPAAGIMLTGGVAQMPGFKEFGDSYLGVSLRSAGMQNYGVDEPTATTAIGIAVYAAKYKNVVYERTSRPSRQRDDNRLVSRVFGWLKELWE